MAFTWPQACGLAGVPPALTAELAALRRASSVVGPVAGVAWPHQVVAQLGR